MIERLRADVVDEGRDHDFTLAVVKELRIKRALVLAQLEERAAAGETAGILNALGGRAKQLLEVLNMIETAKGVGE